MKTARAYAGVGSRSAPEWATFLATHVARPLYDQGMLLRSGAARGMDAAFEKGHDEAQRALGGPPLKEIWLPEPGFNGSQSTLYNIHPHAYVIASMVHPNWGACDAWAKAAHARNVHQVLGADLQSPVAGVLCYTPDGEEVGGTRTAIVLARHHGIPVLNFGHNQTFRVLQQFINQMIEVCDELR